MLIKIYFFLFLFLTCNSYKCFADDANNRLIDVKKHLEKESENTKQLEKKATNLEQELSKLRQLLANVRRQTEKAIKEKEELNSKLYSNSIETTSISKSSKDSDKILSSSSAAIIALAIEDEKYNKKNIALLTALTNHALTAKIKASQDNNETLKNKDLVNQKQILLTQKVFKLKEQKENIELQLKNQLGISALNIADIRESKIKIQKMTKEAIKLNNLMKKLSESNFSEEKNQFTKDYKASKFIPIKGDFFVQKPTKKNNMGIIFVTSKGANVIAPSSCLVVYAGYLKGYGQILILEYKENYHLILSGLSRISVIVGDWVEQYEELGIMSKDDDRPELYMEIRHKGSIVDANKIITAQYK
tara:strand:- start:64 stop:1146 length:1083 start_codon:yes stop_codon:yes gene_type:complete